MTAITRIQEITLEIQEKLDVIQSESLKVGALLIEAREEFKESDKSYTEFLEYCAENFNIGRAQASKLMKIAKVFKEDVRFQGVSMRVMYALASSATDDQIERAAEFADTGTLTSAVVNQLLNPKPPKEEEKTKAKELPNESPELEKALDSALEKVAEGDKQVSQCETSTSEEATASNEQLSEALAQVGELTEALNAANKLIESLRNESSVHNNQKMPPLPQFKSKCHYAVLGLAQTESKSKAKIRKAYRELIKIGYGDGHDSFDILTASRDYLLENAEVK